MLRNLLNASVNGVQVVLHTGIVRKHWLTSILQLHINFGKRFSEMHRVHTICIQRLKQSPIRFLNLHNHLTQTQAAAHLRSTHRKGPEPTGRSVCAGAASYSLQERETTVVTHTHESNIPPDKYSVKLIRQPYYRNYLFYEEWIVLQGMNVSVSLIK